MTSPRDVAAFHAEFDRHPDDRVRLFAAVAERIPSSIRVFYPGSYVDIAPSVWFDDVTYADTDRRAARFFEQTDQVAELIAAKRRGAGAPGTRAAFAFRQLDYRHSLPVDDESIGLLVSLYAGFVSEHCTDALVVGGTLLVNPSHGDVAMASIDPRYELSGVIDARKGEYRIDTADLEHYLVPITPRDITAEFLRDRGRGVGYTRSPFAYLFTKVSTS